MMEQIEQKNGFLKGTLRLKLMIVVMILLAAAVLVLGVKTYLLSEPKTTKLGFEDIGKLATQSVYCTQLNVTEADRKLFGMSIPFTQSRYLYSYDIEIKAGIDFQKVDWKVNDKTIQVTLPECEIISNEVKTDSLKIYLEEESIFKKITLEDNNEALANMQQKAQDDAIANGLFENARSNAETIITGFISQVYDLDEYQIQFTE